MLQSSQWLPSLDGIFPACRETLLVTKVQSTVEAVTHALGTCRYTTFSKLHDIFSSIVHMLDRSVVDIKEWQGVETFGCPRCTPNLSTCKPYGLVKAYNDLIATGKSMQHLRTGHCAHKCGEPSHEIIQVSCNWSPSPSFDHLAISHGQSGYCRTSIESLQSPEPFNK